MTPPLDLVRRALLDVAGVEARPSQFGHPEGFWVNGREVAHIEGDHVVEIRLTKEGIRAQRDALRASPAVVLRPHASDWLEVVVDTPVAAELAVRLFSDAVERYR